MFYYNFNIELNVAESSNSSYHFKDVIKRMKKAHLDNFADF